MMKLVQKILSHGLLIAFVVAAFFLVTNRAELFPQWFGETGTPVAVAANEPSTPAKDVSRPKPEKVISKQPVAPVEPPAPAAHDGAAPEAETDGGTGTETAPQVQPGASAPAGVTTQADAVVQAPPGQASDATPSVQAPSEAPVAAVETARATTVAETPPAATPSGDTTPPEAADNDALLQQQLAQARSLYWSKDTRGAELIYQSLSQAHPENPDVWGEAGNFYYSLQQREQAADAYARAFDLLIQQGQQERAGQLLGVMHQLDEEKARVLEMKLQQPDG